QALRDVAEREIEPLLRDLDERHVVPRRGEHLRDAVAHRAAADDGDLAHATRSTARATAPPPPRHKVARPVLPPRSSSAFSKVMSTRAPLAPIGWPSATAPPFTLTLFQSQPSSLPSR